MSLEAQTSGPVEPPRRKLGDAALRFASAAPLIPGLLWLMFAGPRWAFHLLVASAIAICADELVRMTAPGERGFRVIGVAASLIMWASISLPWPVNPLPFTGILLATLAMVAGLVRPDPVETATTRIGWLMAGPIYIACTMSALDLLHGLPKHGGGFVFLSMALAWLSDTGAYFAGKFFGKHKLYPKLSPKKTIEGSLGGLAGSVVGALIACTFLIKDLPLVHGIILALVAGALGQAGDLFESLLKRSTGVKDSGRVLPGHGGLLDRVDALMFTASVTFLYASTLYPGR